MSQQSIRCNLSTANFPFVSTFAGRTVIIPQVDFQDKGVVPIPGEARDPGTPQIFYGHNIMPTPQGIQSVDYAQLANPVSAEATFDYAFVVRDSANNVAIWSPAGGKNYLLQGNNKPNWTEMPDMPNNGGRLVTKANINNRTLLYIEGVGCKEIDLVNATVQDVTLTGIDPAIIIGICAANNYLVAFSKDQIFWSSPNPGSETDFTPSLVTGAGFDTPQDLVGKIITCLNIAGGFIIYTSRNMISSSYSGNARFPWVFKLVPNGAGIQEAVHVASDTYAANHFAWTSAGFMQVNQTSATVMLPEASDFLSGHIFEDYDEATDTLVQQAITDPLRVQVNYITSRYIILSYGLRGDISYSHAIIHDLALKRWGKVKVDHVDCFEFAIPNFIGPRSYRQLSPRTYAQLQGRTYAKLSEDESYAIFARDGISFLQQDGTILAVNFDTNKQTAQGVLYIGKFALVRSSAFSMYGISVENVDDTTNNFSLEILGSWDGKNFQSTTAGFLQELTPNHRHYHFRSCGVNHTIRFLGAFNLNTLEILGQRAGNR
jgi:hypothetical protein